MVALIDKRAKFQQDLKDVEARLDIVEVASRYIPVSKDGRRRHQAHCPFHNGDNTPSLKIYNVGQNSFHCYGCTAQGGPVAFIKQIENIPTWGAALARARELAGILPSMPRKVEKLAEAKAEWLDPEWQKFAKRILKESRARMEGEAAAYFTKWRGISLETARHFGVGYSGSEKQLLKVSGDWLVVPARVYLFARVDDYGRIRQLKWRNTDTAAINTYGKYSQLTGSEPGIFNLEAARKYIASGGKAILTKGEFEVMNLWEYGYEAVSSTASEGDKLEGLEAALGIDPSAGLDQLPIYYIADADAQGRAYAHDRMDVTPRIRTCYPQKPYKDLGEWRTREGFNTQDIEEMLGRAKRLMAKRKTRMVSAGEEEAQGETVEIDTARNILATTMNTRWMHPKLAGGTVLQVAAQPGVGKGWAANLEATETAREHKGTTGWFAPRLDMYKDQPRDQELWKIIIGRKAAKDETGAPVDFDDELAVPGTGNCTVDGAKFHTLMGRKGWEKESHQYCKHNCPALEVCIKSGYHSQMANDGKNAFMTFAHLFTTLPSKHKHLVIDEIRYSDFIRVDEIDLADMTQLRGMTFNFHMQKIQKALMSMLMKKRENLEDGYRMSGDEFYAELDAICVEEFKGVGLLQLLEQSKAAGAWADRALWELLHDLSPENAEKLPKNIWQIPQAVPGEGGIYDIILEEAPKSLGMFRERYVSRLELLKLNKKKPAVLKLNRRKYLSAEVATRPITVLDATGDTALLRELLSWWENIQEDKDLKETNPIWVRNYPNIQRLAPEVAMPEEVQIIQATQRNFSKSALVASLKHDPERRYFNLYVETILEYLKPDGQATLLVCAKEIKTELGKTLFAKGCTAQKGYVFDIQHYGNLRGSNHYKDYIRLIECGIYNPNFDEIISHGRALFGGSGQQDLDTELVRRSRLYDYRNQEGKALADDVLEFADSRLQMLMEQLREDELYQDAYRIRPLAATNQKEIVLLFGLPLKGLRPNEIVSTNEATGAIDKLQSRSRRAFDKMAEIATRLLSDDNDRPFFTAAQLAQESGCAVSTVYKYLERVAKAADGKVYKLNCEEKLSGRAGESGGTVRRTLTIIVPMCVSRAAYNMLITVGEIGNLIPKSWKFIDIDGEDFEEPKLIKPVVKSAAEAPRKIRSVVALKLSLISEVEAEMNTALEWGKLGKAYILRERRHAIVLELNQLFTRRNIRTRVLDK